MTPTEQDKELRECFSCKKQKIVNEHWLCSECKSEIRTIDDTWLVQEFRKWYSDDEVAEAINQIKLTILFENDKLITTQKRLYAEMVVGEDEVDFVEVCNASGSPKPKLYDNIKTGRNRLRAQQRTRIK